MKYISFLLAFCMLFFIVMLPSCSLNDDSNNEQDDSASFSELKETEEMTKDTNKTTEKATEAMSREEILASTSFIPTAYDTDEIKTVDATAAGSFDSWQAEVFKNGRNNDDPTENSVIISPFHTLTVNGISVPVYTARCGSGAHSFARIDVISKNDEFILELSLRVSADIGKCVVLPESRGVFPSLDDGTVSSEISTEGSFTYTFASTADAAVTDPTLAPLTVMVSRAESFKAPSGYKTVEIEPGYHADGELEFYEQHTAYYIKAGFHDISSIGLPSNSVLYIERGAYIQVTDRQNADGSYNTKTAIHADDVENVKIISRGLLDCGRLQGGDGKYKHVVNTARSNNVSITGLTVINSNTWTICAYSAQNVRIERNLLLSYRTYSDGIMMSECTNGVGRYNFVRTGDDAIEFKGTGWWNGGSKRGMGCVYEYNDLWTDKGAGYCLTWESACPMSKMVFRNNSVGFAQPTWTDRNTAIDCLLGTNADTVWSDITFENIEIYHVISPNAINIQIHGEGGTLRNVAFKNITVGSADDGTYAFRMHFSAKGGGIFGIVLDNVNFCGNRLTADDMSEKLFCNEASDYFDEITIK